MLKNRLILGVLIGCAHARELVVTVALPGDCISYYKLRFALIQSPGALMGFQVTTCTMDFRFRFLAHAQCVLLSGQLTLTSNPVTTCTVDFRFRFLARAQHAHSLLGSLSFPQATVSALPDDCS